MRTIDRPVVTAMLTLGLTACATHTLDPEAAARVKRLGVISMAALEFDQVYVAVVVFGNQTQTRDIASWGVDRAYEDQIAAAAESATKATVVRAPYLIQDFAHVNDLNGLVDYPLFWDPNWDKVRSAAQTYCGANQLDAILFATRQRSTDFIGGSNQRVDGAGMYARTNVAKLYLVTRLTLFDCASGQPLLLRQASRTQDIPRELATKPMAQWTAQDEERLRQDLIALPAGAWADMLRDMFAPAAR
jgi:hypothetical protein